MNADAQRRRKNMPRHLMNQPNRALLVLTLAASTACGTRSRWDETAHFRFTALTARGEAERWMSQWQNGGQEVEAVFHTENVWVVRHREATPSWAVAVISRRGVEWAAEAPLRPALVGHSDFDGDGTADLTLFSGTSECYVILAARPEGAVPFGFRVSSVEPVLVDPDASCINGVDYARRLVFVRRTVALADAEVGVMLAFETARPGELQLNTTLSQITSPAEPNGIVTAAVADWLERASRMDEAESDRADEAEAVVDGSDGESSESALEAPNTSH